ncbi:MAG TPA: hypothetical protein VFT22_11570 [Kofleriaceae bacterium]|nr:hypothetical protein [Kofleriaceae bacterium]
MTHARWMISAAIAASASAARAECPTTPDDPVCRPWSAVLLPTAFGAMYAPHGLDGQFYGGGLEAVLLAWSDNSAAFGPSQGRIRLDVSYLTGTAMDAGAMVMYRGGAQVGFERNASRAYAIPYFAADLGGLWSDATGRRWYADAGGGLYLVHLRSMVLDLEVTGVLPFRDPKTLGGLSTRLGLSFALW